MSFFFLMCSERSGSNLITKVLNGHKNICGPSTKHILNPVARNLFRYGDLSQSANWQQLVGDIHNLLTIDFSIWRRSFSLEELQSYATPGDIGTLLKSIFLEEARANGKKHLFIKENHIYDFFPFLLHHFPESRYIFQTRDPRDMALSYRKNPSHRGGIVHGARQWKADQQKSLSNFHLLARDSKAIHVNYESLIGSFKEEVGRILAFLEVPHDEGIFQFYKDEITIENAKKHGAWKNLSKEIIPTNVNKFETELTPLEIKIIEKICYWEMLHLGYTPKSVQEELDAISSDKIEELAFEEELKFPRKLDGPVLSNMQAKSRFYQR